MKITAQLSRLTLEGVVIVASILLAFAIDAWWQEREERRIEASLIRSLRFDMEASQARLQQWLRGNQRVLETSSELLDLLSATERDAPLSVPFGVVIGVVGTPTYSPTESTVLAAVSSGQIELIQNTTLRELLALWQSQLEDTRDDEQYRRDIFRTQLIPLLSEQIRLRSVFEQHVDFFLQGEIANPNEPIAIVASSELEGALSHFVFFTNFIVTQLQEIGDTQLRILEELEQH